MGIGIQHTRIDVEALRMERAGSCDPLMVSWPAGIPARGEIRDQYCHVIDIAPTIYRFARN